MSSRRRLYLNLKKSITDLFKTPAHYLKEITGKQSIFEKPYFDKDYREMHLNLPVPSWKRPEFDPGGYWPPERSTKLFVIFDDGMCTSSTFGGDCGELITINAWLALVPPSDFNTTIIWSASIEKGADLATIGSIKTSLWGYSATINVQLSDVNSGTLVICIKAQASGGSILKELRYDVPPLAIGGIVKKLIDWVPSFEYARNNLVPYFVSTQAPRWDCGCIDLYVNCTCVGASWDEGASAETINQSGTCTVAILNGGDGEKTWSVTGTGFWFDAGHTKTTLVTTANSVTLYADGTACGTAKVTACGASGYVRCTTGNWHLCGTVALQKYVGAEYNCISGTSPYCTHYCGAGNWIKNKYKVEVEKLCSSCEGGTTSASATCDGVVVILTYLTGCSSFFLSDKGATDDNAYFYYWGC